MNLTGKAKLLEDFMSSQGKEPNRFLLLTLKVGHVVKKKAQVICWKLPKEK